jgi:serine/threonine-protein kinase
MVADIDRPMSFAPNEKQPEQLVGRYAIFDQIAAGGMATVHLARLVGSAGFSRVVAAKRMHRHFLRDPEFRRMFLVEAQLAARILHPNVVPILDVISLDDELIIVMDYVHGESLHGLLRTTSQARKGIPLAIGCAIAVAVLQGLHAAHEARNENGDPLGIVHRDVSPQNVLVGADGVARVLDFGIAKAIHAQNQTNPGSLKGKFSYMPPEVINGSPITRQADVFSAGIVLWEVLTNTMLFRGATEQERLLRILKGAYPSARQINPAVSPALERAVVKSLQVDPKDRYPTALDFAIEVERSVPLASQRVVGEWVQRLAASTLDERNALIHAIETSVVVHEREVFVAPATPPPSPFPKAVDESDVLAEPSLESTTPATYAFPSGERAISRGEAVPSPITPTYALHSGERPISTKAAAAMMGRRRIVVRAIAMAAVGIGATLALVWVVTSRAPPPIQVIQAPARPTVVPLPAVEPVPSEPQTMPTAVPSPSVAEVLPPAADPDPPSVVSLPARNKPRLSAAVERPARARPSPRRLPSPTIPPPRATVHAKHYLPSEL